MMGFPLYLKQILNSLSELSNWSCLWLGKDREILFLNDSAAQIFGWTQEVVGENFSLICQKQEIEDICLKYLPSEEFDHPIIEAIAEFRVKNRPIQMIQWNFFPVKDENNKTLGTLIMCMDVRKNLEDKNTYLYNIINNVPHTIFWKNQESVFLGCNEVFSKFAQLNSPEEVVGLTDYDLPWQNSESDAYRADDKVVMENDQPRLNIEETQTLADGTTIILQTSKVPLHDKQGQVNGVLGVYTDITEKKNYEKILENAKRDADELKKTKHLLEGAKLISGSIAHEIRTPLATIKSTVWNMSNMITELMFAEKSDPKKIEKLKKATNIINKKVDQSNSIINMLLTKLQSIDFEFSDYKTCSAKVCISDALDKFLIPHDVLGKINFNKNNDFSFYGNQVLIEHVLMNLLKNALFFITKADKGVISIWMEKHETCNQIHFNDTGTGISAKIMPHIFDTFFTTETSTGTGVGLAFSKMVMQSHQGNIDCLSEEGEYTKFILTFPKID